VVSCQDLVTYHESVVAILFSLWFLVDVRVCVFLCLLAYLIKLITKLSEA
jgi:hypothetical protein